MDKKAIKVLEQYAKEHLGYLMSLKFEQEFIPGIPDGDLDYAKGLGYVFRKETFTHNSLIKKVSEVVSKIPLYDVSNAFIASLSTRRLELRSALGSYICAKNLPDHPPTKTIFSGSCGVCGITFNEPWTEDLTILNYERYKWGGVRHPDPVYELFDLEQFLKLDKVLPVDKDYKILEEIISTICGLPAEAKLGDVERALKNVLPSNGGERRTLIDILGYCGVLEAGDHKGFFKQYTRLDCRAIPPVNKTDWAYPVMWWRGKYRINIKNYNEIFFR